MQCDFIWYQQAKIRSILQGHEYGYVNSFSAFPNLSHPSDHIPLVSTFSVPRREWVLPQQHLITGQSISRKIYHFFTNKNINYSQLLSFFFSSISFSFISCFPSHLDQEFNKINHFINNLSHIHFYKNNNLSPHSYCSFFSLSCLWAFLETFSKTSAHWKRYLTISVFFITGAQEKINSFSSFSTESALNPRIELIFSGYWLVFNDRLTKLSYFSTKSAKKQLLKIDTAFRFSGYIILFVLAMR